MRHILLLLSLLLITSLSFAQQGKIRGTVIEDESGFEVIGANILVEELGTGNITDLDGKFTLDLDPGIYTLQISYVGFQTLTISEVEVKAGEVNVLDQIRIAEEGLELETVTVTAKAIRTTEAALITIKKKSPAMLDGISSSLIKLTGDATAVEAAKRVTGVSIEGGKYVYVRGLGDRYSKTTLNQVDVPGLDPDRNTLQMDIFPTALINNIVVSKNFTADMPADFTGGLLNIETKDFPDEKILTVSASLGYNPAMNFNSDFLTYEGGGTDFLGFDDGTRELPSIAEVGQVPLPGSATDQEVIDFTNSFTNTLGADQATSFMDYSVSVSLGNQINLKSDDGETGKGTLGYIFSLSYKNDYTYYDEVVYGEYQRDRDSTQNELVEANRLDGSMGERNVLIGILGGLAYKVNNSKYRLTAMRLQNGESRATQFSIVNDTIGNAIGQSGYLGVSNNLEYNQRSLTNILLNGTHKYEDSGWKIDWRLSPTFSTSDDPDIRRASFSITENGDFRISSGEAGFPTRIWRSLSELNAVGKLDLTKNYEFRGENAKLKFGGSYTFKERDYEILQFDIQVGGNDIYDSADPDNILTEDNLYPKGDIVYNSGNANPNPNEYNSTVSNTGFYISNEADLLPNLKTIIGVRAENFVQKHTGRDINFAQTGNGNNLDDDEVLNSFDLFPTVNLIYSLTEEMNLRAAYSRTIARPSFKELSFAQIIDPVSNRIFNGSLFALAGEWDGNLVETRIDNYDLRWELFQERGQLFSVSAFYKRFDNPIELVRLPAAQTSAEFQPRNVGDGQLYGVELEIRKQLTFLSPSLENLSFNGNVTFVQSEIQMTDVEFEARLRQKRAGETIEDTREMAGQAPYVVNLGFTYNDVETGLSAGLFYNVKGETLEVISSGLYPDVYFRPFNSLNFSINKRLGEKQNTTIDFKVSNILNNDLERVYSSFEAEDQFFSKFSPGISFGLGFSHNF